MKRIAAALLLLASLWPCLSQAQTPSALAEWQYSAGEALMPIFMEIPEWRRVAGIGAQGVARYEGATRYRPGPAATFDLRYRDIAFASVAEGLGINLLHGKGYRAGVAATFDMGRDADDDPALSGMGDLDLAGELKAFGEYVIFPVVLRADVRRTFGGKGGVTGDFSVYLPVAGNEKFVIFLGPSASFVSGTTMQNSFGVDAGQALTSGYALYEPGGGIRDTSFGICATFFLTKNREWFFNATGAAQWLLRNAADSPLVQDSRQYNLSLLVGRQW